jgi:hypothetical protein
VSGGTAGADGVRRRTVNEHYLRLFRTPYLKVIILSDTDPYPDTAISIQDAGRLLLGVIMVASGDRNAPGCLQQLLRRSKVVRPTQAT